jgi:hypothetical protein
VNREEFKARVIEYALAGVQGADESTLLDQGIEVDTLNDNVVQEYSQGAGSGDQAYYLQKQVEVPINDGSGTLPTDVFGESTSWGLVLDENGQVASQVKNLGDMYRPLSNQFSYYCLSDGHIYFREAGTDPFAPGSGSGDDTTITVTANFQLSLDTLDQAPDVLVNSLVSLAVRRLREAARGLWPDEGGGGG